MVLVVVAFDTVVEAFYQPRLFCYQDTSVELLLLCGIGYDQLSFGTKFSSDLKWLHTNGIKIPSYDYLRLFFCLISLGFFSPSNITAAISSVCNTCDHL